MPKFIEVSKTAYGHKTRYTVNADHIQMIESGENSVACVIYINRNGEDPWMVVDQSHTEVINLIKEI